MKKKTRITYELRLPVYKQGDDLAFQLKERKTNKQALQHQAALYRTATLMLEAVAAFPGVNKLKFNADCHVIWVTGPKKILERLAADGYLERIEEEDFDE